MSNKYARRSLTLLFDLKTLLRERPNGVQTAGMQLKQGIYAMEFFTSASLLGILISIVQ